MNIMATVSECHNHMSVSLTKMFPGGPDFLRPRALAAFIYVHCAFGFTWHLWFLEPFPVSITLVGRLRNKHKVSHTHLNLLILGYVRDFTSWEESYQLTPQV